MFIDQAYLGLYVKLADPNSKIAPKKGVDGKTITIEGSRSGLEISAIDRSGLVAFAGFPALYPIEAFISI